MLVVIAIIALLAAMIYPQLQRIGEQGKATKCKANLKNL
ncbi:MAG: prepilin-type cleavage/methylation domain-containing protein, partial [Kiritimatiellaeota bacterium]|nr:prepilin-type cleavage/methylation domain-containing protein [Kiritimatiellota bacterium]